MRVSTVIVPDLQNKTLQQAVDAFVTELTDTENGVNPIADEPEDGTDIRWVGTPPAGTVSVGSLKTLGYKVFGCPKAVHIVAYTDDPAAFKALVDNTPQASDRMVWEDWQ